MSNPQPYNFDRGNRAGSLAQSVAGFVSGGLKQRAGLHEKMMEHEMRIRENVVGTVVRSETKQNEIKTQGKQTRKNIAAQGATEADLQKSNLQSVTKAAKKLSKKVAEPGTKVDVTPERASFTAKKGKVQNAVETVAKAADVATTIASGPVGGAVKTAAKYGARKMATRAAARRAL